MDSTAVQKYYTSNINVVAWLKVKGYGYSEKIKKPDGSTVFLYNDGNTIRREVAEYINNETLQMFLRNLKRLKEEVKSV